MWVVSITLLEIKSWEKRMTSKSYLVKSGLQFFMLFDGLSEISLLIVALAVKHYFPFGPI